MYTLAVIVARYLFVIFILYFLWSHIVKRNQVGQNVALLLMHLTAFSILWFNEKSSDVLLIGAAALAIFAALLVGTHYFYRRNSLWSIMIFLMDIGLIELIRLDYDLKTNLATKQLVWMFAGVAAILVIPLAFRILKNLERLKYLYLLIGISLFALVFIFGKEEFGAVNRVEIKGLSFQPSEIGKIFFVLYLAASFRKHKSFKDIIAPSAFAVFFVLMLVYHKDLGGALIYFMAYMTIMFVATGNFFLFFSGFAAASAASFLAYIRYPHLKVRVSAWQNPWADPTDDGYQIVQGLLAIGSGGLWGSGLTLGSPYFIPVVTRDMIFAAICEEFGFIFAICIIVMYMLIIIDGFNTAAKATSRFYSLLAAGITAVLGFQTFLIIGGIVKLIPLTGVTLPFVCYGGSSMLTCMICIGILQCIPIETGTENIHKTPLTETERR